MTEDEVKCVVIHKGQAHRDEFLALGLAIHAELIDPETPVYRRDPHPEDLEDSTVLVLDVGREHDPDRNNIDHHQFERGTEECALSLLAKREIVLVDGEEMTYHELLEDAPWYQATIILDALGPYELAKREGLDNYPLTLQSPIETSILELLEGVAGDLSVGQELVELAGDIIGKRVDAAVKLRVRLEELSHATFIGVKDSATEINALLFDGDDFGVHAFRDKNNLNFCVSITVDARGEGWSLYRFNDDPRVDFSKLEKDDRVLFAHAGGFIAKTKEKLGRDELKELLAIAMVVEKAESVAVSG